MKISVLREIPTFGTAFEERRQNKITEFENRYQH